MNPTPEQINRWLLIGGILLAVIVIWRAVRAADKREAVEDPQTPGGQPVDDGPSEPSGPSSGPSPSTGVEPGPADSRESDPRYIKMDDGNWYELPPGARPIDDWRGTDVYSLYPDLARDFSSIGVIEWDITGQNQALIDAGIQQPPLERVTMEAHYRAVDQWLAMNPNDPQPGSPPAESFRDGVTTRSLDRYYAEHIIDMVKGQYLATMNVNRLQDGVFGLGSEGDEDLGPGSFLPEDFKVWYYGEYYTKGDYLLHPDDPPRLDYENIGNDYSVAHLRWDDRKGLCFINADYYKYFYQRRELLVRLAFLEASALYNLLVAYFGSAFSNATQSTKERFDDLNYAFGTYWKPHAPIIFRGIKQGDHNLVTMWHCMGLHLPGMFDDYDKADYDYACGYEG